MLLTLSNIKIEEPYFEPRAIKKFLGSSDMVNGYFSIRLKRKLTDEELLEYINAKMDLLYEFIQQHVTGEGIEVTFFNEECYNWWYDLPNTVQCIAETESSGWGYNRQVKETGSWLVTIPKPPKYIFEL